MYLQGLSILPKTLQWDRNNREVVILNDAS